MRICELYESMYVTHGRMNTTQTGNKADPKDKRRQYQFCCIFSVFFFFNLQIIQLALLCQFGWNASG